MRQKYYCKSNIELVLDHEKSSMEAQLCTAEHQMRPISANSWLVVLEPTWVRLGKISTVCPSGRWQIWRQLTSKLVFPKASWQAERRQEGHSFVW